MQVPRLRQILPPLPCVRDYSVVEELIKPDDEDGLTKHLSCQMPHFSAPSVFLSSAVTVSHVGPSSSSSSSTAVKASLSAAGLKIAERLSLTDQVLQGIRAVRAPRPDIVPPGQQLWLIDMLARGGEAGRQFWDEGQNALPHGLRPVQLWHPGPPCFANPIRAICIKQCRCTGSVRRQFICLWNTFAHIYSATQTHSHSSCNLLSMRFCINNR